MVWNLIPDLIALIFITYSQRIDSRERQHEVISGYGVVRVPNFDCDYNLLLDMSQEANFRKIFF